MSVMFMYVNNHWTNEMYLFWTKPSVGMTRTMKAISNKVRWQEPSKSISNTLKEYYCNSEEESKLWNFLPDKDDKERGKLKKTHSNIVMGAQHFTVKPTFVKQKVNIFHGTAETSADLNSV